ncbi:high frequency lysogenization protein hflD [Candidatus Photodesmus katoptron]|uniref:High frequency lysogenization protein HflD homolog n=1 Tax=Candidatus Photodesmus katoptron Akat1 TaxID=1236703 RepID=S3EG95_9GAMM|nr:high frequency lysogenization protein HflD [Candidatus Photodesmus katoptron]EPE37193.1 hypothetical protein O1U_0491 [Candidatus Photodesmus katoptron Akat1]KEY90152.1 high frequency lysogenization protein hflD [Candidatus Photodesmus katoptron]
MPNKTIYNRTIAFSGIYQAVTLVQQVAKSGTCDLNGFKTSLNAIFNTNPNSTINVYGEEANLKIGIKQLAKGIDNTPESIEIIRYIINLLNLERKLSRHHDAMDQLAKRISVLTDQLEHLELVHEKIIEQLSNIYLDIISPIGPRIQVMGTHSVIQNKINQYKVRALLLSGTRSVVLWRQVGGKRRNLIFNRKKMVEQASVLLARI